MLHKIRNVSALEYQYNLYTTKRFYISNSLYAPKLVSKTGHLTSLKIISIDLHMRVAFEASQWLAHAGHVDQLFFSEVANKKDSF